MARVNEALRERELAWELYRDWTSAHAKPAYKVEAAKAKVLKIAVDGETIKVKVTKKPAIILGDDAPKLPNPQVILSKVDINEGNMQVAHGINGVLLPFAP